MDDHELDDELTRERVCETCGKPYKVADQDSTYFEMPYNYQSAYQRYCLACWLGVGPRDFPEAFGPEVP